MVRIVESRDDSSYLFAKKVHIEEKVEIVYGYNLHGVVSVNGEVGTSGSQHKP
jgi:hypothetical protein